MWRRGTMARVLSSLALAAGCGLIEANRKVTDFHASGSVIRTFDAPVSRVLAAVFELDEQDIRFEDSSDFDFPMLSVTSLRGLKTMNNVEPGSRTGEAEVPLENIRFGSGSLDGKTRDGRPVRLWLLERDQGQKTEVSLLVGESGDPALSKAFLDRVAEKLAHPSPRPSSGLKITVDQSIARSANAGPAPVAKGGLDR